MKALIIGAAGFVGNYLIKHIQETYDWELAATKLENETLEYDNIQIYNLNILYKEEIISLLKKLSPDYIFYLAAQSSVALSWKNPSLTVDINIKGCLNLLECLRELEQDPKILLIGSGEEYGYIQPEDTPVKETTVLTPGNIYAATKACQNMLGAIYARAYNMHIVLVRAFNHIGPGQAPAFVVSDFCRQVALIENGTQSPVIKVGNLEAKRDFTDVRDVVRAYGMLIQKGEKGHTYNVGSGHAVRIRSILENILKLSTVPITVEVDSAKLRPLDIPIIEADISKLTECIAWKPEIPLIQTLRETLDYWRQKIKE